TVNNATYSVDAATSASVTADVLGKLTITQQTSNLGVPDLWVHVDKLMKPDEVKVLQQYANGRDEAALSHELKGATLPRGLKSVEARVKDVTADELANDKDARGDYLLNDSYRKKNNNNEYENAKKLADAFNKCMQLRSEPKSVTAALHPLISRRGTFTGAYIVPAATAFEYSRVIPHHGLPSWMLSFEEGGVQHRTLT